MTNILIYSNGSEPLNEMASMPTYGKHSSPKSRKLWAKSFVYSIGDSWSTKFVQMMIVGWPLTLLQQGQIFTPKIHLYGDIAEKSVLQYMFKGKRKAKG